jgi:hypothetical protein
MNSSITKTCRICGRETPYDELVKHKECSYGVDALCKTCSRAKANEWYHQNKDRASEVNKNYQARNREKYKTYKKEYAQNNREKLKAYHERWRALPENAEYRAKVNIVSAEWRNANKERQRKNVKQWRINNPERSRTNVRNRRARKRAALGKHSARDVRVQLEKQVHIATAPKVIVSLIANGSRQIHCIRRMIRLLKCHKHRMAQQKMPTCKSSTYCNSLLL